MSTTQRDEMNAYLRSVLLGLVPPPSGAFRRRAWEAFEQALDRHLAAKRGHVTHAQTRR